MTTGMGVKIRVKCGCATLVIDGATMSSASTTDSMTNEIPRASRRRQRSRTFVTASPSTKHRLRAVSVVACSGSLLPCMDAPHSGGTPSGRGGVAIRRDSEERALAQLDTEAWPKFPLARLRNETSAARDTNQPLSHSIIVSYSDPKLMCTTLPISCISWILLPSYWSGRGEIVMSLHSKEAVGVRYT